METTNKIAEVVGGAIEPNKRQSEARAEFGALPKAERLLRLREVEDRCGIRKSAIYAAMAVGKFPMSVQCSARTVAWKASDIESWINSLPQRALIGRAAQ